MRRCSALVLSTALFLMPWLVVPPSASATGTCVGLTGVAATGAPLFYPVTVDSTIPQITVGAPTTTSFSANFAVGGACVQTSGTTTSFPPLEVLGIVSGWCGHFSGTGTTPDGYRLAWINVGDRFVMTGEFVGVTAAFFPDFLQGDDCLTVGADSFFVWGNAGLKVHCLTKSKGATTIPMPTTSLTPVSAVSVSTSSWEYGTKVCAPTALL